LRKSKEKKQPTFNATDASRVNDNTLIDLGNETFEKSGTSTQKIEARHRRKVQEENSDRLDALKNSVRPNPTIEEQLLKMEEESPGRNELGIVVDDQMIQEQEQIMNEINKVDVLSYEEGQSDRSAPHFDQQFVNKNVNGYESSSTA